MLKSGSMRSWPRDMAVGVACLECRPDMSKVLMFLKKLLVLAAEDLCDVSAPVLVSRVLVAGGALTLLGGWEYS